MPIYLCICVCAYKVSDFLKPSSELRLKKNQVYTNNIHKCSTQTPLLS